MSAIPVTENYFNHEIITLAGSELKLTGSSYPERELYRQVHKEICYDEKVEELRKKIYDNSELSTEIDILEAETGYLKTTLEELKKNLSSSEAKEEYKKQARELNEKLLELGNKRRVMNAFNESNSNDLEKLNYTLNTTFIYKRLGLTPDKQKYEDFLAVIEAEPDYNEKIEIFMVAKGFLTLIQPEPQTTSS
jgi:hypothetical protein